VRANRKRDDESEEATHNRDPPNVSRTGLQMHMAPSSIRWLPGRFANKAASRSHSATAEVASGAPGFTKYSVVPVLPVIDRAVCGAQPTSSREWRVIVCACSRCSPNRRLEIRRFTYTRKTP
jgi:hypothetical protein